MHHYGVRDVEKLLRLPRSTIRALIAAGFVSPARGPRKTWRFSFQDLILLRTAQALATAKVPAKRITRSLKELRRQLPETMPLSGLSIGAVGKRVVVRDGTGQRQVESGQYLLAFEGDPAAGSLSVIERTSAAMTQPVDSAGVIEKSNRSPALVHGTAEDWFERGVELEQDDAEAAIKAYEQAVSADPARLDARTNLGRLLHESGRLAKAEQVYRQALVIGGDDPLLLYNLGVLLEDMDRSAEAMAAYQAALRSDPVLADCHYNLALLCEKLKKPKEAIRHMSQYRRLVGSRPV